MISRRLSIESRSRGSGWREKRTSRKYGTRDAWRELTEGARRRWRVRLREKRSAATTSEKRERGRGRSVGERDGGSRERDGNVGGDVAFAEAFLC